jgi:CRP-like cAMP-binding protein
MNCRGALEAFLSRLRLRSDLSAEEGEAILAIEGREVHYKRRANLLRPRQTVDFCCLVVDGLIGRFEQLYRQRQITALYVPGDVADLHTLVVPHAGWGFEALAPTMTLRVPHVQLCDLATRYPAISLAFSRDTVADASIMSKWLSKVGRRQATARLAHLVCEFGLRLERTNLGHRTHFHLPLRQDQLQTSWA